MTAKEFYKEEKAKLEKFKKKLSSLNTEYCVKDKFFSIFDKDHGLKCYCVCQNLVSIPLFFAALKYPNTKTCFFVEAFNFFQNLSIKFDYPYCSYSQALTTYYLKILDRRKIVEIQKCLGNRRASLESYMEMLGNNSPQKEEMHMFETYFYKMRSLRKDDLSLLYDMMRKLGIDVTILDVYENSDKIYLKLKKDYVWKAWRSGEITKRYKQRREFLLTVLYEYYDYLFNDEEKKELER